MNSYNTQIVRNALSDLELISIADINQFLLEKKHLKNKKHKEYEDFGGIYIIWWTGKPDTFKNLVEREIFFSGVKSIQVAINITDSWIDLATKDDKICLYVGKSIGINYRLWQHFEKSHFKRFDSAIGLLKQNKIGKGGPFRGKILKYFCNNPNLLDLVFNNVGVSYSKLSGDFNSVNRFYLEHIAIAEFKPLLNIDIER